MPRAARRGVVLSFNELLLAALALALFSMALAYFFDTALYGFNPEELNPPLVEADYCGTILVLQNIGAESVELLYIYGFNEGDIVRTEYVFAKIDPGETLIYNTTRVYDSILVALDEASIPLHNSCYAP